MRRVYNITVEEYDQILASQKGRCAMCGRLPTTRRLAVDHDHKTGLVRGLLCWTCNRLLGSAHDSPEVLQAGADFLRTPPAVAVIGERYGQLGRVTNKKRRKRRTTVKRKGTIG